MNEIGKTDANTKIGGSINDLGTGKQDVLNYQGILNQNAADSFGNIAKHHTGELPEGAKRLACVETELSAAKKGLNIFGTMATQAITNINVQRGQSKG